MRYVILFLLFFSSLSFAQTPPPQPTCTGEQLFNNLLKSKIAQVTNNCLANPNTKSFFQITHDPGVGDVVSAKCKSNCTCPAGSTWYQGVNDVGTSTSGCSPDSEGGAGDDCDAGEVYYEGFCRDAVASPGDCGSTYNTAIAIGSLYACANASGCSDGSTATVFTNASGSWNVCGAGDSGSPSSSGSNTSAGTNTSSGTNTSAGTNTSSGNGGSGDGSGNGSGDGGGSGSGNGSGSGDGNGSGSTSSSPTNPGSGSASSGIGNGGSADAANCENGEPLCDGDPVQCAILVQLWINNCAGYDQLETNNPDNDNEAIQDNFDALISSAEPSVNAEGVLTAMTEGSGNGTGNGSGSGSGNGGGGNGPDISGLDNAANSGAGGDCPADRQITLGAGTFNISFQFFCDFASQVSGLVILIFSYIGVMIVYRSLNW